MFISIKAVPERERGRAHPFSIKVQDFFICIFFKKNNRIFGRVPPLIQFSRPSTNLNHTDGEGEGGDRTPIVF